MCCMAMDVHSCLCMIFFVRFFVLVCAAIGVGEIIASEPGGECRQAITHGAGLKLG